MEEGNALFVKKLPIWIWVITCRAPLQEPRPLLWLHQSPNMTVNTVSHDALSLGCYNALHSALREVSYTSQNFLQVIFKGKFESPFFL